jgi:hypothetical protein
MLQLQGSSVIYGSKITLPSLQKNKSSIKGKTKPKTIGAILKNPSLDKKNQMDII